ncbi:hypothetical protein AMAG_18597 [Allomyces macrogynus ATCC 38327]|uniref:Uncharacterized protein n=1 Tax=Allomyces macrogynus (strain ATCC 38327) TaxID=578462 RepID=A0A0L0SE64_ALLM3|nr:hypothetical protein AMAG_18597 [Allomyces macrogynus ATCC 38327]|eukprot:KNE60727.1 hypothetical protein AMAG_18597 [Allomyces macrogynus ATCC 38327]
MPTAPGAMATASPAMTPPAPRPLAMPTSMSMVPTMHGMPATTFALSAAMYAAAPPTAMAAPIAGRLPVPVPMPVVYQHYPPYATVMHAATASARLPAPRGPAFPVDITSAMASSNFLSALDPVPVPAMPTPAGTNTTYAPRAPSLMAAVPSPVVVRRPPSAIPSPVVTASVPALPAPASTLSSPPPSAMASSPPVAPSPLVIRQESSTPSLTVPTEASGPLPVAASLLFTAQQQQAARAASASSPAPPSTPQPPSTPPSVSSSSSTPPSISSSTPPPPLPVTSTASPSTAVAAAAESEAPWPRMALSPALATSSACSPALPHDAHDTECSTPLGRGASSSSTAVALPVPANNYDDQGDDMDTAFAIPPEPPTAPVPLVDVAATGGHLGHAIGMGPTTPMTLTTTSGPPVSPGLAPQPSSLLFDPAELAPLARAEPVRRRYRRICSTTRHAPRHPSRRPGPQQHHPWAWPGPENAAGRDTGGVGAADRQGAAVL